MNFFSKGQQKNEMFVHKKNETLTSLTIEYLEWPCTVNSRLASWTIPDLFLSREKYRCRAEIDHFTNQLLNLQGFISVGGECLEIQMQEE